MANNRLFVSSEFLEAMMEQVSNIERDLDEVKKALNKLQNGQLPGMIKRKPADPLAKTSNEPISLKFR